LLRDVRLIGLLRVVCFSDVVIAYDEAYCKHVFAWLMRI